MAAKLRHFFQTGRVRLITDIAVILCLILLTTYVMPFFVVFNIFAYAQPEDGVEGYTYGPRPYVLVCPPDYHDIPGGASYSGNEWALRSSFFVPHRRLWCYFHGEKFAEMNEGGGVQ